MKEFDVVQAWLNNVAYSHSKSENTAYLYKFRISRFCDFVGKTPQQILEEYERMTEKEFRRRYGQFLRAFISELGNNGFVSNTVSGHVTAVRSFFKYNDLPLGYVPVARRRIVFHNRDITKEDIEEILKVTERLRDKAFFCMMAQTGLRPVTLSQLRVKHIEPDFGEENACWIKVPSEIAKGKYGSYHTFMPVKYMGRESASVRYLRAYFKRRRNMIPEDYVFTCHGSDKPVNTKSMAGIFARTVEKLRVKGLIDVEQKAHGKPRSVRLYNLRKWFRNQAGSAGRDFVNCWMGHSLGVDEHYFSKTDIEKHRQHYIKEAMPHLRIEVARPTKTEEEIIKVRTQLRELERQNIELRQRLNGFTLSGDQVKELLRRIEELEKQAQRT